MATAVLDRLKDLSMCIMSTLPCWSNEIDLIGNVATILMEGLRYEHSAKFLRVSSFVALNGVVALRYNENVWY